ncbi:MAG: hypothetical protein AAF636_11205 [Pseudomonadota bacterium]
MRTWFKNFRKSEDGAVTVDWVVLTAAVCGMCISMVATLSNETNGVASGTNSFLSDQEAGTFNREEGDG